MLQTTYWKFKEEVCSVKQRQNFKDIKGTVANTCNNISRATYLKLKQKSKSNRLRVEKKLKIRGIDCLNLLILDLRRPKVRQNFNSCEMSVIQIHYVFIDVTWKPKRQCDNARFLLLERKLRKFFVWGEWLMWKGKKPDWSTDRSSSSWCRKSTALSKFEQIWRRSCPVASTLQSILASIRVHLVYARSRNLYQELEWTQVEEHWSGSAATDTGGMGTHDSTSIGRVEPRSFVALGDRLLVHVDSSFSTVCLGDTQIATKSFKSPSEESEQLERGTTSQKRKLKL